MCVFFWEQFAGDGALLPTTRPALVGEWGRHSGVLDAVSSVEAKRFAQDILPLAHVGCAVYEWNLVEGVLKELDKAIGMFTSSKQYSGSIAWHRSNQASQRSL